MLSNVTNNIDIEEVALRVIKSEAQVFVWDVVGTEVIKVPVKLKNFNSISKVINFELDHRAKSYIKDLITSSGFLKFFIPASQTIFISGIKVYRGSSLEVKYPESMKKHERRKEHRIEPLLPVHCNLFGHEKECFDISLGGYSTIVNNMEFKKFKLEKGMTIDSKIVFSTEKIKLKSEIVNVIDIKPFEIERFPYGAKRVSFKVESNDNYRACVERVAKGMKKLMNELI